MQGSKLGDFGGGIIDLLGRERSQEVVQMALDKALSGDVDVLKKFLDKILSEGGGGGGGRELDARMKAAQGRLDGMTEDGMRELVGDHWLLLRAGRLPVAAKERHLAEVDDV